jgi:hypothetical protein
MPKHIIKEELHDIYCIKKINGEKIAYIGMTNFYDRRKRDHYERFKIGKDHTMEKIFTKIMTRREAIFYEKKYIKEYLNNGYTLYNKAHNK